MFSSLLSLACGTSICGAKGYSRRVSWCDDHGTG
jgi:hypothetical protein